MEIPRISRLMKRFAKSPEQPKPPTIGREQFQSTTGSSMYTSMDIMPWEELNPWSSGWQVLDKMTRDETIKASLSIIKMAITSPGFRIQPSDSKNQAAIDAADWWTGQFEALPGSVGRILGKLLTAIEYGFSITECVLGYDGNLVGLKKLKPVRPHDLIFVVDEFGTVNSVFQVLQRRVSDPGVVIKGDDGNYRNLEGGSMATLPRDRVEVMASDFVHFTQGDNFGDPRGKTALVAAHRSWWSKDNLIKFWNMGLEKFGVPWVLGEHMNLTDEEKVAFQSMIENVRSLSQMTIPKDRAKISLIERQASSGQNDPFEKALMYHDLGMTRAMLMPSLLGFGATQKAGSYSQSDTHFKVFMWVIDAYGNDLEETINEQILAPVNRLNFPPELWPKFKFNPRTEEDKQEIAKIWTEATEKGSVTATLEDEDHFRELTGFPEIAEEEKKRRMELQKRKDAIEIRNLDQAATGQPPPDTGTSPPDSGVLPPAGKKVARAQDYMATDADYERLDREERTRVSSNVDNIAGLIDAGMPYLEKQATTKDIKTSQSMRLPAKFVRDLREAVNGMMIDAMTAGMRDVHLEIGMPEINASAEVAQFRAALEEGLRKYADTPEEEIIPHVAARKYLEEKAFYVTGVMSDNLTKAVQQVISEKFQNGMTNDETIDRLHEVLSPYTGGEVAKEVIKPYRLETIVRTNQTEAYNRGRLAQMTDPALKDFVLGYRFSAILDDRTTDQCAYLDGKDFPAGDTGMLAYTPPLHFNALAEGTRITTQEGDIPIERINVGDLVLTHKARFRPVYDVMDKSDSSQIRIIKTDTGRAINITGEHPMLTQKGWKRADELEVGDTLSQKKEGAPVLWEPATITHVFVVKNHDRVWNLAVKEDETYLAEGIIVHNCRSLLTPVTPVDRGPRGERIEPDFISDKERKKALDLIPAGFGGQAPTITPPKKETLT